MALVFLGFMAEGVVTSILFRSKVLRLATSKLLVHAIHTVCPEYADIPIAKLHAWSQAESAVEQLSCESQCRRS